MRRTIRDPLTETSAVNAVGCWPECGLCLGAEGIEPDNIDPWAEAWNLLSDRLGIILAGAVGGA
jgi:hypothetical protein